MLCGFLADTIALEEMGLKPIVWKMREDSAPDVLWQSSVNFSKFWSVGDHLERPAVGIEAIVIAVLEGFPVLWATRVVAMHFLVCEAAHHDINALLATRNIATLQAGLQGMRGHHETI